ncbi:MAG: hypothetical protein LAO55_12205 [Acidobacteriia bacterium]|nr:hypothetical protein [Terriglobia bacterium]
MSEEKPVHLAQHPQHGFASDQPYNTGIMVVGDTSPPPSQRTIVITGTPRGGTTMLAECLATLGLPMGIPVPPPVEQFNFEDLEFQKLLQMESPGEIDMPGLRALILSRNTDRAVWGFKLPMALNSLPVLEQELRNPQFILVFRDVVAVSSREVVSVGFDAMHAMRRALVWQERMLDFVENSRLRCLLISYEKALQFPDIALDLLISWCGLEVSGNVRDKARATMEANREPYLRAVSQIRKAAESI